MVMAGYDTCQYFPHPPYFYWREDLGIFSIILINIYNDFNNH